HALGHAARLRHWRDFRHRACRLDRACAHAGKESLALGDLLADGADPRDRADHHCGARRHRHPRAFAEVDHLRLSVLLPGHDQHGEGLPLAGPDPAGSDAHLVGEQVSGVLEAALAVIDSVFVYRPQSGRDDLARRCHCRRAADRRAGRHRRAPPHRLLLRTDRADLGGADRRLRARRRHGRDHRLHRQMDRAPHGNGAMPKRWLTSGFYLAALGCLAGLALPLSSETMPGLTSRPALLAATLAATLMFALSALPAAFAAVFGIAGTVLGCSVT